jgi:hypothetical protein
MGFEQQTPRKRLRAFKKIKKTKHRSLNFCTQHTLTRGDYGPNKPTTIQSDSDIRHCFDEREVI